MRSITFFGTRGSYPIEGARFSSFGGATTCVLCAFESAAVMIDCGSGVPAAADALARLDSLDLLLTHGHLDHVSGIVTLVPLMRGRPLRVWAPASARAAMETLMSPPLWPVALKSFPNVTFREPPASFAIGGVTVETMPSNHVGDAVLYRLTEGGASVVIAFDFNHAGGFDAKLAEFARGCSVLVYDGSMTEREYACHPDWGHSTPETGCRIAAAAGAGRLLVTHHGTAMTDEFLRDEEARLRVRYQNVSFAAAGQTVCF